MLSQQPRQALLAVLTFARLTQGYEPGTGSEAAGDLTSTAPYGIPASTFETETTKRLNTSSTFNITGYDTSSAQGLGVAPISGWSLKAAVATQVPLTDSTDDSAKDKVTDATTLSIIPPSGTTLDDSSWAICAVVYSGISTADMQAAGTVDGTCNAVLSSACTKQMVVDASVRGMASNGSCIDFALPTSCTSDFPTGANGTSFALNSTIVSDGRFYAYGAAPVDSGNDTAAAEAIDNIWPVLLIWSQMSNGQTAATVPALQCVSASANGTGTGDDTSAGRRVAIGDKTRVWWLLLPALAAVMAV